VIKIVENAKEKLDKLVLISAIFKNMFMLNKRVVAISVGAGTIIPIRLWSATL
jgi:hypothetical protein